MRHHSCKPAPRPIAGPYAVPHEVMCGMRDVEFMLDVLRRPARKFHAQNRTRHVDVGLTFAVYGDGARCDAFYPHTIRDVTNDPRERDIAFRAFMAEFWWRLDLLAEMERARELTVVIHLDRAA